MMMQFTKGLAVWIAVVLSGSVAATSAEACSRVFSSRAANGQAMVVGRTMDLYFNDKPVLAVRPRGLQAGGTENRALPKALSWRARYGSVGVVSAGKVFSDGLNEAGLNANLLYLSGSAYGKPDPSKPALSNGKLVTYVLDNFATVSEALEALSKVQVVSDRILNREWPLHLSMADRSGDSAVIEFINGKMVVHRGDQSHVMTNEPTLDWQLQNIKRYKPFGGALALPGDVDPASRFVRAATFLKTLPKADSVTQAEADVVAVMKNVSVVRGSHDYSGNESEDTWTTLWTSVANLDERTYAIQLARNPYPIWVEMNKLRLDGGGPMRVLDIQPATLRGDVTELLNRR